MCEFSQTRRSLLKRFIAGAVSLFTFAPFGKYLRASPATLDPRQRIPNPYVMPDGRPVLLNITGDDYNLMLRTGLAALGGLGLLIDNNQDVLIKPNLVYTEEYPTTSAISSIVSTIQAVGEVTTGTINVGDSGGMDNQQIYDFLGIEQPILDAGANLLLFDETYFVRRSSWPQEMPDFEVWTDIYDTPVLINLCSLKRHYAAYMTCAIKHHVGTVSGPNRIDTRDYLHDFQDQSYEFLTTLAEIAGLINPELTIVDAREIMAINGPLRSYGGEIRNCGHVIMCGDMVAADAFCAQLLAIFDETFQASWMNTTLERAEQLGLGTADLDQVEIINLEQTSIDDFRKSPLPEKVTLYQNYPNPFNATTTIKFSLPERMHVRLDIFDLLGRKITTLTDAVYEAGANQIAFRADGLSSGVYYYQLTASDWTSRKAMVLAK